MTVEDMSFRHCYLQVTLRLWTGASWGNAASLPHHTVPSSCYTTTRVTHCPATALGGTVKGVFLSPVFPQVVVCGIKAFDE